MAKKVHAKLSVVCSDGKARPLAVSKGDIRRLVRLLGSKPA